MNKTNNDRNSLAHTVWNCKYHIVFAPKYRRKVFFEEKRLGIREIFRKLCEWKGIEIIEGEICPDHIHILVSIPPKISVSSFMGYLKGKSTLMIFERHANLKYKYGNRHFWLLCRYCRKKCEKDPRVYPEPIKRGFGIRPNDTKRVY